MKSDPNIIIAGAGSIGCFVGGLLLAAQRQISFLGRQRISDELLQNGLHLTDYSGLDVRVPNTLIKVKTEPKLLAEANIVLVCVKSSATTAISEEIARYCSTDTVVISLQNGVRNADLLKSKLPAFDVRAGMVPFNVVQMGNGRFHRGTSGEIVVEQSAPELSKYLCTENLQTNPSAQMQSVLWGKLLVNLNNALNALSGVPLVEELSDRKWRTKLASQMAEGLSVLNAEGIKPTPPSPVPAWVLPYILRLPTPIFRSVAKQMLAIDPKARSSMWEDLKHGRKTEIEELQGEIIKLGHKHGIPTPINQQIYDDIKERENAS